MTNDTMNDRTNDRITDESIETWSGEAGKVGKALLLWMLGVPGGLVLLYLIFAN